MFTDQLTRAIATARAPQLDHLSAELWKAYAAGALSDDDAQAAAEAGLPNAVTPQEAALRARPELMITHAPAHGFVADLEARQLALP